VNERNIRLLIAYDGTRYSGWQRQRDVPTIQGEIEDRISLMTGEHPSLHGAGRTDAGVHALGMVAHFHTRSTIPVQGFLGGLNSLLPRDIRILDAAEVAADFHSRFQAVAKTYRYDFFTGSVLPPCDRLYTAWIPCSFSLERMQSSLERIIGSHDFSSFEGKGSRDREQDSGRGAVRTLFRAECRPGDRENFWSFSFTGDGFLRHMVRNLVGTLIYVARGMFTEADFSRILAARDRTLAGPTAPACGLFLQEIFYPPVTREQLAGEKP